MTPDTEAYHEHFPHWSSKLIELIPHHMHGAVVRYILQGIPPGGFLTAVLENDLQYAAMKADDINRSKLHDYCMFLYNYAPGGCHGSREVVHAWMSRGGSLGQRGEVVA